MLDLVRSWYPPFSPATVIAEASDILKTYRLGSVTGDRYAAGFVLAAFSQEGIEYVESEKDRSALFLELLPLVNSGRVRLLDDAELLRELRGLERTTRATRDKVDHRPGAHGDRAVATAQALVAAAGGAVGSPTVAREAIQATLNAPATGLNSEAHFYGNGPSVGRGGTALSRAAFGS